MSHDSAFCSVHGRRHDPRACCSFHVLIADASSTTWLPVMLRFSCSSNSSLRRDCVPFYIVTACHFTCVLVSRAYRPCSSNVTVCWCFITPPRLWTRNAYLGTILQRYYCTNCKYLGARTAVAVLVKRAPRSSHMKYGRWTLVLCNSIRYISSALVRHA